MKYTIAFDVYGTLIDTTGIKTSLEKLIGKVKAKPFMDLWRNKQLEYSFRRGLMNEYVDFSVCTKEALEYSCLIYDIEFSLDDIYFLMQQYKVLPIFSNVKESLVELKKSGHQIFAFSNGNSNSINELLVNNNISHLFHGIVSVEDVKTFKPNPLVYKHFNSKTNSNKNNSILVSSNSFDAIGAINYGMKSFWINRNMKQKFDVFNYIKPSATLTDFTEILFEIEKIKGYNKM